MAKLALQIPLALYRQALNQQARCHIAVGRQNQARVELLALQHIVL